MFSPDVFEAYGHMKTFPLEKKKKEEENAFVSKLENQSPLSLSMMLSSHGFSSKLGPGRYASRGWISLPPSSREWGVKRKVCLF